MGRSRTKSSVCSKLSDNKLEIRLDATTRPTKAKSTAMTV
jgi:hypothetical protein